MTGTAGKAGAGRLAAIGCLMAIPGFFGGGMIAVLVAKVVGLVRRCVPVEGLPACRYEQFLWPGALIGAVLLPALIVYAGRRGAADGAPQSERG